MVGSAPETPEKMMGKYMGKCMGGQMFMDDVGKRWIFFIRLWPMIFRGRFWGTCVQFEVIPPIPPSAMAILMLGTW